MKAALIASGGVAVPMLSLVLGVAAISGGVPPAVAAVATQVCVSSGPIRGLSAVAATNWNKSKAADRLQWSRMTLYRKMATYNIVRADRPAHARAGSRT